MTIMKHGTYASLNMLLLLQLKLVYLSITLQYYQLEPFDIVNLARLFESKRNKIMLPLYWIKRSRQVEQIG